MPYADPTAHTPEQASASRYKQGCHCDLCRAVSAKWETARRHRNGRRTWEEYVAHRYGEPPPHGTEARYSVWHKCRCELCREAASARARARREKNKQQVIGPRGCDRCGSFDRLESHHRDPMAKVFNVDWSWRLERILEEFSKCDVLCHDCHVAHHRAVADSKHGERSRYLLGCRCELCRKASQAYHREWRARRRLNAATEVARSRQPMKGQAQSNVA